MSYVDTVRMIIASDGWKGLFGRGLKTRIIANALQSTIFTIIWRGLTDKWNNNNIIGNGNDDDDTVATDENSITEEGGDSQESAMN